MCVDVCRCASDHRHVLVCSGVCGYAWVCSCVCAQVVCGCMGKKGSKFENSLWEQTELNLCQNSLQTVVQGLHEKQYCTKHQLEPILKVEERAP